MNWLTQHATIVGLALTAASVIIALIQVLRRRNKTAIAVTNSTIATNSPMATGSGNTQTVVNAQHAHFGDSPFSMSRVAPETHTKKHSDEARPNFHYVGVQRKHVFVSPDSLEGVRDPRSQAEQYHAVEALVLRFENRVEEGRRICPARNVIARIRFESQSTTTWHDINYGVWLNSPCNSTEIGVHDTGELVLLCKIENEITAFSDKRSVPNESYADWTYLSEVNIAGFEKVKITLVDKSTQVSLTQDFKIWREGQSFSVSIL